MSKHSHFARQPLGVAAFLGTMALLGAAFLPNADAQVRGKPGAARPAKPAKPGASAAASAASASTVSSSAPATTAASAPAAASAVPSTGPVPAPRAEAGDGGVRTSPLNPNAEEMPGYTAPGSPAAAPLPTVDYDKLLGDIAALRARVADVSDALFVSRIVLSLETDGDHAKVGHLTVELDDGVVYTAQPGFNAADPTTVYEHAVAPGHHAVTVEIDRKDDRDDTFRDAQRTRFIVDVPKDQRLEVLLRVADDSTMAKSFPSDHRGKYDLRVRMQATAAPVKR
jgi:hypothetical protein